MCFFFDVVFKPSVKPLMARLLDSVAPEVKKISSESQPIKFAIFCLDL